MTGPTRRSRSTTAASQRPRSRGSTASVHSGPQQQQQQHQQEEHNAQYPLPEFPMPLPPSQHHMGDQYSENQMSMLQNAAHGVNPQHSFDAQSQALQMSLSPQMQAHYQNQPQDHYYPQPSMPYSQSQHPVDYGYPQQAQTSAPFDSRPKKLGSASSQTNDKELRELLSRNHGRTLTDVAQEVLSTERTPRAEKTKQLFAMLWLGHSCETAKTSVPRGRVYSTYANGCALERVQPLNPASFGKLVRVIFPGIQTRRLGIRGESKYHYVDLALKGDVPDGDSMRRGAEGGSQQGVSGDFAVIPRLPVDTTILPTEDQPLQSPTIPNQTMSSRADGNIFVDPTAPGYHPTNLLTSSLYEQRLEFHPPTGFQGNDVIDIPDIWDWARKETDVDAADALVALYRTHCTSLVDSVRFCKEKSFFRLYNSFQGTLTVPVHKLFVDARMAGWVKECDWRMYQKMLEQLYPLTLQVMPVQVMRFLDNMSKRLHHHITKTFSGLARHVLEAKLEPANLFCELVCRMLKVNQTAHAAARVVEGAEFRESLLKDWIHFVNPKRVMESELPGCGYEETYRIITQDIPALLSPINPEAWSGHGSHYQETNVASHVDDPSEPIVDRIGSWLLTLPSRFPNASARTLVDCIKNIGTAAMRDMTIGGATSFNAWWILKVYVDEMAQWLASSGGFLSHRSTQHERSSSPLSNQGAPVASGINDGNGAGGSQRASRLSSLDADFTAQNGGVHVSTYQSNAGQPSKQVQHQTMMSSQHGPVSQTTNGTNKRRSTDAGMENSRPLSPGKKMRFSQDSEPQFDPQPSFATSSFASTNEVRPISSHDMHDDSGIDLGLFMDNSYDASKEGEDLTRAHFIGQGGLSPEDAALAAAIAGATE